MKENTYWLLMFVIGVILIDHLFTATQHMIISIKYEQILEQMPVSTGSIYENIVLLIIALVVLGDSKLNPRQKS